MNRESILVVNSGSSSMKFAVIDCTNGDESLSGLAECLNTDNSRIRWKHNGKKTAKDIPSASHKAAFTELMTLLQDFSLINTIKGVGHRVVHGGETFTTSCLISDEVIAGIKACEHLAPLHTPANLAGINAAMECFSTLKHVAVFDTSFHQTMPEKAYRYALPDHFYKEKKLRRYGMHGTSYRFVCNSAADILGLDKDKSSFLIAHLGNGASAAAVKNGKSADTTMGLTPLEGLVMGTRCGSIDPNIFTFLNKAYGYDLEKITHILNNESGLLGLSGVSNDCRILEEKMQEGNSGATLAMDVFCYNVAKQVVGLSVSLDHLDALIFTGGIGENSSFVRANVLQHMSVMGFSVDNQKNDKCCFGKEGIITDDKSIPALVITTNEELMISQDTAALI